jgi:hypothetical protein
MFENNGNGDCWRWGLLDGDLERLGIIENGGEPRVVY